MASCLPSRLNIGLLYQQDLLEGRLGIALGKDAPPGLPGLSTFIWECYALWELINGRCMVTKYGRLQQCEFDP